MKTHLGVIIEQSNLISEQKYEFHFKFQKNNYVNRFVV